MPLSIEDQLNLIAKARMAQEGLMSPLWQEVLRQQRLVEETAGSGGYYVDPEEEMAMRTKKFPPPAMGVKPKMMAPPNPIARPAIDAFRGKAPKKKMK